MKVTVLIIIAFTVTIYLWCFDFKEILFLNYLIKDKHENQKEIIENYSMQVLEKKSEYKHYIQSNSNIKNQECKKADNVKQMIVEYINDESKRIYEDMFISALKENNKKYNKCYFPRNNEVSFFWSFVEDILVENAKHDTRAMRLLIDLYFTYEDNAELSAELFSFALRNAAVNNLKLFVKELSNRSKQEANICVSELTYIKDIEKIEKIRIEIEYLKEPEYQEMVNIIKAILPD